MRPNSAICIDLRNESSLEMKVEGTIDLFFSDSDMPIREQEVRRYLPQMSPFGIILMHDASSHLKEVREAALKLEREGLISVVLLPDAARAGRGAEARRAEVDAQKRGRGYNLDRRVKSAPTEIKRLGTPT